MYTGQAPFLSQLYCFPPLAPGWALHIENEQTEKAEIVSFHPDYGILICTPLLLVLLPTEEAARGLIPRTTLKVNLVRGIILIDEHVYSFSSGRRGTT